MSSTQTSFILTCWQRRSALKRLTGRASVACLLTVRGAGLLLLTTHLLAVLVRDCPRHSGVEKVGWVPLSLHSC